VDSITRPAVAVMRRVAAARMAAEVLRILAAVVTTINLSGFDIARPRPRVFGAVAHKGTLIAFNSSKNAGKDRETSRVEMRFTIGDQQRI